MRYNPMRGARVDFSECRRAHFYPELPMPSYCDEYFKYFQPGPISEEKHELYFAPPEDLPDEETDEYKRALWIYEDTLRRTDEALTPWEFHYWRKRMYYLKAAMEEYWPIVKDKGVIFGREMTACLCAGTVLFFLWWIILAIWGPLRFRTIGMLTLIFVLASTLIRGSIDLAATSFIGLFLVGYVFFNRIASGYVVEYHRDREVTESPDEDQGGAGDADGEYAVVLRFSYWYCGNHNLLVNITKGIVAIEE